MWYCESLRESIALHALIGGVGSLVLVPSVIVLWVLRQIRGIVSGVVQFRTTIIPLSMLIFVLIPAMRDGLISIVKPAGGAYAWVSLRDPVCDVPICKNIMLMLAFGSIAFGANAGIKYFASPPEVVGEVAFIIGADGRRIDDLPRAPWPQFFLSWALWLVGVLLLLFSTHSDVASLVVAAVVLIFEDWMLFFGWLWFVTMRRQRTARGPSGGTGRLSASMYQEQGRQCTVQALTQLREHLRS